VADTVTPNIKITNQTEGGNNNTWGVIADANFERIDDVMGDVTSVVTTGGNTTLTDTQELVNAVEVSGTLVSNATVTFSGRGGAWIVKNETTGDYSVTCLVSGQTGVVIPPGTQKLVYCDGVDILFAVTDPATSAEVTVASAATTDILGAGSEFIAISGTATITSLGTGPNVKRFVRATGAFTLTHNATSLVIPGAANITVAAGDTFVVISDASSNARVFAYQRAAYVPPKDALNSSENPDLVAIEALAGTTGALRKTAANTWALDDGTTTITFIRDGNGTVLPTGVMGDIQIPFACTITGWTLLANASGSIVIDIWKDTYANYPPTDADSITAAAVPSITSTTKNTSSTLTGWTTSIAANDTLRFNIDSVTTITRISLLLHVKRFI